MKQLSTLLFCFILMILGGIKQLNAQLSGWSYLNAYEVVNKTGPAKLNFQVLLVINTKALIAAGKMQSSGADIRFADSCTANANVLPHYIVSDINTDTTKIWVKIPSITANGIRTIYLVYGNTSASSSSSQANTFPGGFISAGNSTLSGTNTYNWFQVRKGDTVFATAGSALNIKAKHIKIDGVIFCNGKGYAPNGVGSNGAGNGAGTTSVNQTAGSGAAGYGGLGGNGGYDAGDSFGKGGTTYGTVSGTDIAIGSSGASSDLALGGSGGGSLSLTADLIEVTGSVFANGDNGVGAQARNGGGGSGGGILGWCKYCYVGGSIAANGGNGGVGTSTANDDGGGGGGGRIKLFYGKSVVLSANVSVNGGKGGPNGTAKPGQDGGTGSAAIVKSFFTTDSIATKTLYIKLSDADGTICDGAPLNVKGNTGFSTYSFYLNSNLKQSGSSISYNYTGLKSGDSLTVKAAACGVNSNAVGFKIKAVIGKPTVKINALDTNICLGDTAKMTASGAVTYAWIGGPKTAAYNVVPAASKAFMAIGTDANGCFDTARKFITVNNYPGAVNITGNDKICVGDSTSLKASGASHYIWDNGATNDSIWVKPASSKDFTVWGYENVDCKISAVFTLTVLSLPNVYISGKTHICPKETLFLGANGATYYTWSNGSNNTTESFKPVQKTTYWLKGKDDNGCINIAYKTVSIDTNPKIMITGKSEICKGESSSLNAKGGVTYKWMNGSTKQNITLTPTNTSFVFVVGTDDNSCSDTGKLNLKVNNPPAVSLNLPAGMDTLCASDGAWTLTGGNPAGGNYKGFGISSGKFSPALTGTGKFRVTYVYIDAHTCSDSAEKFIVVDQCLQKISILKNSIFLIYPNPANEILNIVSENAGRLEIWDASGKLMQQQNVMRGLSSQIWLYSYPSGIYFAVLRLGNGKNYTQTFNVLH